MLDVGRSIGWKTSWGEGGGGESELITDDLHQAAGGILDISDGFCQVLQTIKPWSAKRQSETALLRSMREAHWDIFCIP